MYCYICDGHANFICPRCGLATCVDHGERNVPHYLYLNQMVCVNCADEIYEPIDRARIQKRISNVNIMRNCNAKQGQQTVAAVIGNFTIWPRINLQSNLSVHRVENLAATIAQVGIPDQRDLNVNATLVETSEGKKRKRIGPRETYPHQICRHTMIIGNRLSSAIDVSVGVRHA